jgi:hypothetical protein
MDLEYYYNNVPGKGLCRNNLIYTSLISKDKKTFVQWYYNDTKYHHGQNQVIDPTKMSEKWARELCFLNHMNLYAPECIPVIKDIDLVNKKIYLEIDGPDFWEQAGCDQANFNKVLPDWQDQMLNIIRTHRRLGLWKYSMHPSSYFIVDGKLKSINYFFTYTGSEPEISIKDVESHISLDRKAEMQKYLTELGIKWDLPQPYTKLHELCWESFRSNYPDDFVKKAKEIYLT